jgi:dipeptidyl aminopeptidase/acylaminoacyl peptidase
MRLAYLAALCGIGFCLLVHTGATATSSLPISAFGKLPSIDYMSLSASGRRFAFVSQEGAHRQLFIREVGGGAIMAPQLGDAKIRRVWWAGDDIVLISASAAVKAGYDDTIDLVAKYEVETILVVNLTTKKTSYIFEPMKWFLQVVDGEYGERRIGGRWYGFYGGYDDGLYRVDLQTNETKRIAVASSIGVGWVIGSDGAIVARVENNEPLRQWQIKVGPSGSQTAASKAGPGSGDLEVLSLGRTPGTVLVKDQSGDRDLIEEYPLIANAKPTILFDSVEPSLLLYDPDTSLFLGATTDGDPKFKFYDPVLQARYSGILRAFPSLEVTPVDYTAGLRQMIILTEGAGDAGTYWFVDLTTGKASELAERYPDIRPDDVGASRIFQYSAADGLNMEGVLTLPPGASLKNLPLIVLPHGGPIGVRDKVGFDWWAQGFASKGYAVFQPNFRGSSGYGPAFRKASHGEWGRKMQTDLSDGVAALASKGIIDPTRVCIVGASYGGYAALAGVTIQHGVYRCAVAVGGVSDLGELMAHRIVRGSDVGRFFKSELGTDFAADPNLALYSPLHRAADASAPILLIHGTDDTVVSPNQSNWMFGVLQHEQKSVQLIKLDGEDHWLSRSATRTQMLTSAVDFVEKYNPSH